MRNFALICFLAYSGINLAQQTDSTRVEADTAAEYWLATQVVNGDTVLVYYMDDVVVLDKGDSTLYKWMLSRVRKTYPLALHAKAQLDKYNADLEVLTTKKEKRKYMGEQSDVLKDEFKDMILDMSESEGNVLCKLLHRETGLTGFEIIETYKGSLTAFTWQTAAKLGGADITLTFDPEGEDFLLDYIVRQIERGDVSINLAASPRKD